MRRINSITGFILAGGASRRMGRPKTLLKLAGITMIERQAQLLRQVTSGIVVMGWPAALSLPVKQKSMRGVHWWPDILENRGPLGGIYAALERSRTEYNLFLGCDLPFMEAAFLEFLGQRALDSQADVTIPKSRERRLIPVCAVYRRRARQAIRKNLEAGENKITRFYPNVQCEIIPWREISRAGFGTRLFENMNTKHDYENVKMELSKMNRERRLTIPSRKLKPNF